MKAKRPLVSSFGLLMTGAVFLCQLSLALVSSNARAADPAGVVEKTKETAKDATAAVESAAKDAKESLQDASRAVGGSFENLWRRVDESRIKNRSRDEVVAWVIVGVLVSAVAGMFTSLKTSGAGQVGRLLLGLAGAFIGGVVVNVARINFGWGPVLIRYEELLFSLAGAILLILGARAIRSWSRKPAPEK